MELEVVMKTSKGPIILQWFCVLLLAQKEKPKNSNLTLHMYADLPFEKLVKYLIPFTYRRWFCLNTVLVPFPVHLACEYAITSFHKNILYE